MPQTDASKEVGELYKSLQEQLSGMNIDAAVSQDDMHAFNIQLQRVAVDRDEVPMEGDDFPYIRSALIDEAIERGDIEYNPCVEWADDATITINGEEYPIEDGDVTIQQ